MNNDKGEEPSTARRVAWSISSDINVIAIYRMLTIGAFTALIGLISYLGVGLISGQTDIALKMAVGNTNIANTIQLIDAANHRVDMLLLRVNDIDHRTTVLETRMNDGRGR